MERLWTPWRMSYVSGSSQPPSECLFCELPKQGPEDHTLLLQRGQYCFSVLNLYPYNTGHLMVAPYAHSADLAQLPAEVGSELWALSQRAVAALSTEYRPDGFNIGMNLGLLPVTGIPLPLISFGGSSLVTSMAAIGVLESIIMRHRRFELF